MFSKKNFFPKLFLLISLVYFFLIAPGYAYADMVKGIYLSQSTLEDTNYLQYLMKNAKEVGINAFVIDLNKVTEKYKENIPLVKQNNLKYVVRIVMFPGGGTDAQIRSRTYWEQKYALVKEALNLGADEVQLDYIRYNTKQPPSPQNAQHVKQVIAFFKQRLDEAGVPLQIDVFGISSFRPSKYIGQDIALFADQIDALCPMLYPSHFEPFREHALTPYETILTSLHSIQKQLNNQVPFKIYTYIELSNYRYKYAAKNKLAYIQEQIRAVEDAKVDGWYAWSANNYYDRLFALLRGYPHKPAFDVNAEKNKAAKSA